MKFDVLLLVIDATTYKKRTAGLSINYPKMKHALHRVCETICMFYANVNNLVDNWKKSFVISPVRIQLFESRAPDIPFLTNSRITLRGTWLDAIMYYTEKYFALWHIYPQFLTAQYKIIPSYFSKAFPILQQVPDLLRANVSQTLLTVAKTDVANELCSITKAG